VGVNILKILTTKVREGSVSGVLVDLLVKQGYEVNSLRSGLDVRQAQYWPAGAIPADTDILINTVGVTDNDPTGQWDLQRIDKVISTNLTGAITLTEAFYNATKHKKGEKLVIHIGSAGSRKVFTNCAAYCASKAGLAHYVSCVGYEMRDKGFNIVGVHPDNIAGTPMTNRVQRDLIENRGMAAEAVEGIYKRAINAEQLALYISQLVANNACWKFMTGENYYLGAGCKRGY
jgi:NAD(P)-dependent dehydrogenase (short-subunit alcohol dehydrogenase family)